MLPPRSVLIAASLILAACGTTPEERGVSGAGIGAAGGAVVGAVTGLTVLEGAALGAAGGALAGVLTDPGTINLGEPIWKRGSAAAPASNQTARAASPAPASVTRIQSGLSRLGYAPGPVDGVAGPRTREAIRRYQQAHGLLVDGEPSEALAQHIEQRADGGEIPGAAVD